MRGPGPAADNRLDDTVGRVPGTVLVRCDVGPSYGIGHLMRCVALAEEYAVRGFAVVFSADVESVPFARDQLQGRGFGWVAPPETTDGLVEQALAAELVVVDSYVLPRDAYTGVRRVRPTLALVDGDPAGKDGDLVVDQNIGAELDDWRLPEGTTRLAGLDYALMRDEIRAARADEHAPADGPTQVFAFFGGTDAFGAAPVMTRALVATGEPFGLRVVAATAELRAELSAITPGSGQRIDVLDPTNELAAEVTAADLVVSAAGTSSWELLCLGAACAFVCVADNQELSYGRVVELGAVAGAGRLADVRIDPAGSVAVLAHLLRDEGERRRLRAAGSRLVDGRGRERVADALTTHVRSR
jgi:spore coat polysaccharide biosynthesis predicted glycosyltransferase SpsG